MQSDAVNRRDADRSRNDVFDFLKFAPQSFISRDDLLRIIVQHLSFASKAKSLFAAFDQKGLKNAFQRADLLAHCRLSHIVNLRRLGKTFRFRQITKNLQTLNLHKKKEY